MWVNVSIQTRAEHAEALSEALMDRGALSVSVEDADAGTDRETPQFGEPGSPATPLWSNSKVVALFSPSDKLTDIVVAATREIGLEETPVITFDEVAEENWVQLTQAQFEPIEINDRLWIVPSWHMNRFSNETVGQSTPTNEVASGGRDVGQPSSGTPTPTRCIIQLDPGMAFGTGSHPTTRLCLEWLLDTVRSGDSLLDYGCGSGILAIAGAKLGARPVVGVEIDEQALDAAAHNAVQNGVSIDLRHSSRELPETFDLVVANILTNPLCVLAPLIVSRLRPEGRLALSGVLESQAQQVIDAYAPRIALTVGAVREGWCRLEGRRHDSG